MKLRAKHNKGASLMEYMLVLCLIAGICYASLNYLGIRISSMVNNSIYSIISAMGP